MSYILGLNLYHANSSACIISDNEIIAASEEERFTRIKNYSGFPKQSIIFCLDYARITLDQISAITINQNFYSNFLSKLKYILKFQTSLQFILQSIKNKKNRTSSIHNLNLPEKYGSFNGKLINIEHHLAHIASAFYASGFNESVNLSIDGFGDFCSTAWGKSNSKDDVIVIDQRINFPHSLGIFYQAITQYLGFKNYGDEYKIMGLSAYGDLSYQEEFKDLVNINDNGSIRLNLKYFNHEKNFSNTKWSDGVPTFPDLFSQELEKLLGPSRKISEPLSSKHFNIARCAQHQYEKIFFKLLNFLYKKYKCDNLTLSGGCALNSLANGKVISKTPFKKIYIPPNPADGGGSVGSALAYLFSKKKTKNFLFDKNLAYLGSSYSSDEIKNYIFSNNLSKTFQVTELKENELYLKVAKLISEGNIIGWFQDRTEWGPRALGNRSILADPRNNKIQEILNLKIKRRENFRPFAPSVLHEQVEDWFVTNAEIPFMTEVYPVKEDKKKLIPAVVHVDGTGRIQTVNDENNFKFYKLISEFDKITGVPMLLNTSFNENEPIVNNPQEAINCFLRTKMDVLVLHNWIIRRQV